MLRFFFTILLFFSILSKTNLFAQGTNQSYRIMFYNVENLFDTLDNPNKNDDDFTPQGSMNWDGSKYHQKLKDIYQVLMAVGQWNSPNLIGFAEVENKEILDDLVTNTPLNKFAYKSILEEADDKRGIDVGLIYRSDIVKYVNHKSIKIFNDISSRDILLFTGIINNDTLNFFINHWPSRLSGKEHSEYLRLKASDQLIKVVDSVCSLYQNPNIIILGDFNDTPTDKSIQQLISHSYKNSKGESIHIQLPFEVKSESGSVVYTDVFTKWYLFDQIMLSENLTSEMELQIFRAPWLLNSSGHPNRTYLGNYYNGGISDHLPVYIDITIK